MTDTTQSRSREDQPFKVASITKTDPPEGTDSKDWYRYVITQGTNTIVGCRQGSLKSVTQAVEEMVGSLNERRLGKVGRVHLTPTPKKRT